MKTAPTTGLLVLHGNRLELLAEAVLGWLARNPLQPLEEEVFLVQSNGMAEWVKMEVAATLGVCAATRVELPARFIWRAYRAVLGRGAVPGVSPLDKLPLTWRLMALLPALAAQPGFEPVAAFLGGGEEPRRLQLAERLADLLDQYQVYRADWLQDWAQGHDRLRTALDLGPAAAQPVPPDQSWQPALWRALLAGLQPEEQASARPALQQRFLQALKRAPEGQRFPGLPRRVVLFGTTHIPHQTLEAIAALSAHCQVLMAVPNPCRFHWADIIDGRELLRAARRRHPQRPRPDLSQPDLSQPDLSQPDLSQPDLSQLPLQDLHAHGHPLLAAWGRQGRDFVRQLDEFDDVQAARERFKPPRVDLFNEGPGQTLLEQVQAHIRELQPLQEHPKTALANDDRSIVFHIAHGPHREVEILHDQLLRLFAEAPAGRPLHPRDVVVMVPDIDSFAPAIRAVFGQHARTHARHIPWGLADQSERGHQPILVALEWLLNAPQQRFAASELRDLLDVPSIVRRHQVAADDLPTLVAWVEDAGIRWGLHQAQRASLGLAAAGEANTWAFGLRRMLLGYATGALDQAAGFEGIEPHAEVAGLSVGLAGALAELLQALDTWWQDACTPRTPAAWAERLRALVTAFFAATDDSDRAVLAAVDDALSTWLHACELAGFADPVELAVAREAWLGAVDEPGGAQRFRAGGVTFCTLLPLRAIPFEVVCLLGMNDGDYPRRSTRSDFDLMALPGLARPGDRSRRSDDRQLMLDALLSARRVLYLSWAGRSARDNQSQPPSVLVSQLRDYLAAGWGKEAVQQRTTEHPLQPFSRRYFERGAPMGAQQALFTYASEWREAHVEAAPLQTASAQPPAPAARRVTVDSLARFLRNPVKAFFKQRLQVSFDEQHETTPDDESFGAVGLDRWALLDEVLRDTRGRLNAATTVSAQELNARVQSQLDRLQRAGRLPLAGPGQRQQHELAQTLQPMVAHWQQVCEEQPLLREKLPLMWAHPEHPALVLDDWLVGLRAADADSVPVWVELLASEVTTGQGKSPKPRADKLLAAWVRCLASAACGQPSRGIVIGRGAVVEVHPPDAQQAQAQLAVLLQAFDTGLNGSEPWPTAVNTGLAWLASPEKAQEAYEGSEHGGSRGEGQEPCLARLFPRYADLSGHPCFESASAMLYRPLSEWLDQHAVAHRLSADAPSEGAADE
jgi:exodeoxyribonuclease V gamma subunit